VTNRLAQEASPYLRQHADNPVDWYAWGEDAFAAARERDVPILLSVGYSACHWCHVMAHESFEDDSVAAVMNDLFVNVKVDREERPDVDSLYMDAVQALSGHGGWPMTVFLAPDGRPFFGGTYYPKPNFLALLRAIHQAWVDAEKRPQLLQQAGQLTEALAATARVKPAGGGPGIKELNAALMQLAASFDTDHGGFGREPRFAPKFPQPTNLELILRAWWNTGGEQALQVVRLTADAMASGGIYDHLGGGFARYSVDREWLVPHFEKMLYDQAGLVRLYTHLWQVGREDRYAQVVDETVAYVLRDLRQPGGGFASAEDADSEGEEGRFYTWTLPELREVLGDGELLQAAVEWWGVRETGNFEGRSILFRPARGDLRRPPLVEEVRQRLFAAREHRVRPGLDDKVLTEWNAMMIAALAEAGAAFGRGDWLAAAEDAARFLLAELRRPDGRWLRSWQARSGARNLAVAADHAQLVDAFTRLAEATGRAEWVGEAEEVAHAMLDLFWDASSGGLFTVGEDAEQLVVRQKDLMDNATPSANSQAAWALLRLHALTGEPRWRNQADQILQLQASAMEKFPSAFSHLLAAADLRRSGAMEIAVTGERPDLVRVVQERYLPNAVLAWGEPFDSPLWQARADDLAYVCRDYTCAAPVTTPDDLAALLVPSRPS
jgi:uncharacterized protein